ncbi:MotA/TolQ/ExbB proton channel family protein [Longimicrobium sp.]|uniref:MotA/TolQ/ExbB proton channel family protein n=1 Tax=Longimicrobium sp. TaxID=2029185 RepID=UPI002ED9AB1B
MPEPQPAPVTIRTPTDLEVPLSWWLGLGVVLAAAVAGALFTVRGSFLAALVLDRGLTQLASLYLACATVAFLAIKAARVVMVRRRLRDAVRLQPLPAEPTVEQAREARDRWARAATVPALRRARALQAYMVAGTRAAAAAKAEEDAVFAQSAMEQSYSLPRAFVWAIPLMGFIGTVVGISAAVAGFSSFLRQAEEIEQIKTGIGAVTTGLAVAFDTTLLALALSVLVMLPLVLLERLEGRVLLALEADVSDAVVAWLPDTAAESGVDRTVMVEAVGEALAAHLPEPREMVRVAEVYLRQAAMEVAAGAREAAAQVAQAGAALSVHHEQAMARIAAAEEEAHARIAVREAASADALTAMLASVDEAGRATVGEVRAHAQQVANGLAQHASKIAQSLDRVGATLQQRAEALERHSAQLAEVVELERSLERTLRTLETTGELRNALAGVERSMRGLQPAIERLAQPRRIMLVEADGGRPA